MHAIGQAWIAITVDLALATISSQRNWTCGNGKGIAHIGNVVVAIGYCALVNRIWSTNHGFTSHAGQRTSKDCVAITIKQSAIGISQAWIVLTIDLGLSSGINCQGRWGDA